MTLHRTRRERVDALLDQGRDVLFSLVRKERLNLRRAQVVTFKRASWHHQLILIVEVTVTDVTLIKGEA